MDFSIGAVHLLGISSILNSINIIITSLYAKTTGWTLNKISLLIFAAIVTSILLILVVPVLAVGVTLIFLDRNLNTGFLDSTHAGDEIIFQHIFWVFGHPEVYIIIIPVFGLINHIAETSGHSKLFGTAGMIFSTLSIA